MRIEIIMKQKPAKDLIGQKFGRLTVIAFEGIHTFWKDRRESFWKVRCDCGTEKVLRVSNLRTTKSCGCLLTEFRKNNLPKITKQRNQKPTGEAAKHSCYKDYVNRSKKKNISFELTKEQFLALTQYPCYYCGREPRTVRGNCGRRKVNGEFIYNGLDRIDSDIGYKKDNIVTCCEICNKAKRDMSQQDFLEWINDIILYRGNDAK